MPTLCPEVKPKVSLRLFLRFSARFRLILKFKLILSHRFRLGLRLSHRLYLGFSLTHRFRFHLRFNLRMRLYLRLSLRLRLCLHFCLRFRLCLRFNLKLTPRISACSRPKSRGRNYAGSCSAGCHTKSKGNDYIMPSIWFSCMTLNPLVCGVTAPFGRNAIWSLTYFVEWSNITWHSVTVNYKGF